MSNIGDVFVRPDDGSQWWLRLKKRRSIFAVLPAVIGVLAFIGDIADVDWVEATITFLAEHVLRFPKVDGLLGAPLELAVYARTAVAWLFYAAVSIFWVALGFAFWMRSDMLDALHVGLVTQGQAVQGEVKSILGEVQKENGKSSRFFSTLNEIKNRLSNPREPDVIDIALFGKLLVYAPLFVADGMGYFAEEGLKVNFHVDVGDDKAVAAAIESTDSAYHFGACDPYFCLAEGHDKPENDGDLLILMPLAKRFGFTLLGKSDVVDRLDKGPIKIGSYEQGSTTYLAATAFRNWLIEELVRTGRKKDRADAGKEILIETLAVTDPAFEKPEALERAIAGWDFVLLWEPQISWVRNGQGLTKFGTVGVPVGKKGSQILAIEDGPPKGASGKLGDGTWRSWLPDQEGDDPHKCLISALLVRRSLVKQRPVLCRRVFRALSRASTHLQGLDWDLDALQEKQGGKSLFSTVRAQLLGSKYVNVAAFREMVSPQAEALVDASERGGVFPFVYGLSNYDPTRYTKSLLSCHHLWDIDKTVKRPLVGALTDYERYFVKRQDLETT